MSELGESWRALKPQMKAKSQAKKQSNYQQSKGVLERAAIPFEEKDESHFVIRCTDKIVYDFWPTTGTFMLRGKSTRRGRGVFKLLREVRRYFK